MKNIERFIDVYKNEINDELLNYSCGTVVETGGRFLVGYNQVGAEPLFTIGEPLYDNEKNLLGYLGIGLYKNLNYSNNLGIEIPVERWEICLPTKHCSHGTRIYTYWHLKNDKNTEKEN